MSGLRLPTYDERQSRAKIYLMPLHFPIKTKLYAILREACDRIGIDGASTHSFRRSGITNLHKQGYALHEIAQISGHRDITNVSHYIG
ncbi:MAG: tyrosine-type recombinase/integrase [Plectolyngbya sp. WJT66-NPBG17]|jgi:integrase|nr:tyrosine-type recombinase/integrase [Plectolyngbya sp. WJT66-NPBG17]